MAKARAICRCETCGKEFEKTAIKANCTEADNWEEWAQKNLTECPSCAGKRIHEEEVAAGLIAKFRLGSPLKEKATIYAVLFGDTYSLKEQLKAIKAIWTDDYPETDGFWGSLGMTVNRPFKRWVLRINEENFEEACSNLTELGFKCELPNEESFVIWSTAHKSAMMRNEELAKEKREKQAEIEAKKAEAIQLLGAKPAYPEEIRALWPEGAKWNGKIYGKKGHYRVYFSGTETSISDEQKVLMETVLDARREWEDKKEEIDKKYK